MPTEHGTSLSFFWPSHSSSNAYHGLPNPTAYLEDSWVFGSPHINIYDSHISYNTHIIPLSLLLCDINPASVEDFVVKNEGAEGNQSAG